MWNHRPLASPTMWFWFLKVEQVYADGFAIFTLACLAGHSSCALSVEQKVTQTLKSESIRMPLLWWIPPSMFVGLSYFWIYPCLHIAVHYQVLGYGRMSEREKVAVNLTSDVTKPELVPKELLLTQICAVWPVSFAFSDWQPPALENSCWWKLLENGPAADKQAWKGCVICLLINDWLLKAVSLVNWEEKWATSMQKAIVLWNMLL